ncbi:MAG TPA: SDR family oxidoreductase [Jiangellaceae bacterium]
MRLTGKVAVVTGSAANIGRATAVVFAREGAEVVVTAQERVAEADAVVNEITAVGGRAIRVQADLARQADVDRVFREAIANFGRVDVLVNNAGRGVARPFLEASREDWVHDFDDNFFSMVLCSQAAARLMLGNGGGVILNTTSIRGIEHTGRAGVMAYSAAKAAAISFTKTLAKELAPLIRVNAVAPGFVMTPNYDSVPDEVKEGFIEGTLIKRWIQPEEIAEAFLYLATAEAVTGENLVVDGAFTLK